MSENYKAVNDHLPHFCTITVINWINLFAKRRWNELLIESLEFCAERKGLVIHAYCIMSNHVHLIVSAEGEHKLGAIMRDFKKYTSSTIVRRLEQDGERRADWLLEQFAIAASKVNRNKNYKVWQDGFHPVELSTNKMLDQRLDYLHNNPVKAGLVSNPEDYLYSSARQYAGDNGVLKVEFLE